LQRLIEGGADAIVAQKGMISYALNEGYDAVPFIAHLSASTVHGGPDTARKVLVGTVEEAVRRGAAGVSAQVNLGSDGEADMLISLGQMTDSAQRQGIPSLGMVYPRGAHLSIQPDDLTRGVAHAVRLGFEIGCDVVKVPLTDFPAEVAAAAPIPVLFAGGDSDDFSELLTRLEAVMAAGGAGVCMGRQIFGADDVVRRLRAVRAVVHDGLSATAALTKFG
jgi:DhnA family fructose-bisphosphate aldolase class Ia